MPDAKSADKVKNVEICLGPIGPHQWTRHDLGKIRLRFGTNKPSSWPASIKKERITPTLFEIGVIYTYS